MMRATGLTGFFLAVLFLAPATSHAMTYSFFIEADTGGATVTGYFTGTDTVTVDGILDASEITDWAGTFDPGTSGLMGFSLSHAAGDVLEAVVLPFSYTIGSTSVTLQMTDPTLTNGWRVIEGQCPNVGACFLTDSAGERLEIRIDATVQPIPVPAAVWLFGSAMLAVAGIKRRRR